MAWIELLAASLVVWGLCGAVIGVGRRIWSMKTTLAVHLVAAPIFAFCLSALHRFAAPEFDPLLRAIVMTGVIVALDGLVVAPLFERSFAMFRSVVGTWLPFGLIFLASWTAGV